MLQRQATKPLERGTLRPRRANQRQALEFLGILMIADRGIAERLLRGEPLDSAIAHPHYGVVLNEDDRAVLLDICDRAATVDEVLAGLAEVAEAQETEVLCPEQELLPTILDCLPCAEPEPGYLDFLEPQASVPQAKG